VVRVRRDVRRSAQPGARSFCAGKEKAPVLSSLTSDALGKGGGWDDWAEEREQKLKPAAVELDGFDARSGVILMAATNARDSRSALLRAGGLTAGAGDR